MRFEAGKRNVLANMNFLLCRLLPVSRWRVRLLHYFWVDKVVVNRKLWHANCY